MLFEITHRFTGAVLFSLETESLKLCVEAAIKSDACLAGANLAGANLAGAHLAGAYLAGAHLAGAYIARANLAGAHLAGAYLAGANLAGADLAGAYLAGANLAGAHLAGAKGLDGVHLARTRILPQGALIGWKKCGDVIVKLRIPEEAKRSHAWGRKCRAEYADVLDVIGAKEALTDEHGPKTVYRAGERVYPDKWDDDWKQECSHGIHFYITKEEAEAHY